MSLSEQLFIDCVKEGYGCDGGSPFFALEYAQRYGANYESEYPYENAQGPCRHKTNSPEKIVKHVGLTQTGEQYLYKQLAYGPIAVAVCGTTNAWKDYKSGYFTFNDCNCRVNHAVSLNYFTLMIQFFASC